MEQHSIPQRNGMAKASLIFGILSVLSILSLVYIMYAPFLGSMSIVFALLSRGDSYKMPEKALGGFITSIISIVLAILITVVSFYLVIQMFGLETALDPTALNEAKTKYYNDLINSLSIGGNGL